MNPFESHAWFQAASLHQRASVYTVAALALETWRLRLHDYLERQDIRSVALGGHLICPHAAASAAAGAAVELAVIVTLWPDEPRHVLRSSRV